MSPTPTLAPSAADRKRLATLQAAAALRGFVVQAISDGGYMVSRGVWLRDVEDMDALVSLLARMGVMEVAE